MDKVFKSCKLLNYLPDISKWDTTNVKYMREMFSNCTSLLSLPDISCWNVSKVSYMSSMFFLCSSLLYLPDISKWKVSCIPYNFASGCFSLLYLPNIPFDMNKSTHYSIKYHIFNECINAINPENKYNL